MIIAGSFWVSFVDELGVPARFGNVNWNFNDEWAIAAVIGGNFVFTECCHDVIICASIATFKRMTQRHIHSSDVISRLWSCDVKFSQTVKICWYYFRNLKTSNALKNNEIRINSRNSKAFLFDRRIPSLKRKPLITIFNTTASWSQSNLPVSAAAKGIN